MNNKEFGKLLARICFKNKIKKIPFILNAEQADAFKYEWYLLSKK